MSMNPCCCCSNRVAEERYPLLPSAPEEFDRLALSREERDYTNAGECCMKVGACTVRPYYLDCKSMPYPGLSLLGALACAQGRMWGSAYIASSLCSLGGASMVGVMIPCAVSGGVSGCVGCCLLGRCCILSGVSLQKTAEYKFYHRIGQIVENDLSTKRSLLRQVSGGGLDPVINLIMDYADFEGSTRNAKNILDSRSVEQTLIFPIERRKLEAIACARTNVPLLDRIVDRMFRKTL